VANKKKETIRLSPVLWAQIHDLEGFYGDHQGEVLTHILTDWFSQNQTKIEAQKAKVRSLGTKIQTIQEQAAKEAKSSKDEAE
jgi:hypothetical protein